MSTHVQSDLGGRKQQQETRKLGAASQHEQDSGYASADDDGFAGTSAAGSEKKFDQSSQGKSQTTY